MSTEAEIRETVDAAARHRRGVRPAALPVDLPRAVQGRQPALPRRRLAEIGHCPVGYSGHERGFHVPVAAVALGAKIVEKHFTIDRELEGNDHKVSLLPDEFAEMVQRIREVEEALGSAAPRAVSTGEMMNRVNLAKSLVAARRHRGRRRRSTATPSTSRAPAAACSPTPSTGWSAAPRPRALRRRATSSTPPTSATRAPQGRALRLPAAVGPAGPLPRLRDADGATAPPTSSSSTSPTRTSRSTRPTVFAATRLPTGLTPCHSPDLFAGDFLLNLASDDDDHWERSIAELQRVIDTDPLACGRASAATTPTRSSSPAWAASPRTPTCRARPAARACTPGSPSRARPGRRQRGAALRADAAAVPLVHGRPALLQPLRRRRPTPPTSRRRYGRRLCLDVSHSKLAANFVGMPFSDAIDLLAPHADHLHLVDATGVDGEGVQVGDGEIDWARARPPARRARPGRRVHPRDLAGPRQRRRGLLDRAERLEQWF